MKHKIVSSEFIEAVAYRMNTTVENIMSKNRARDLCVLPRQLAQYVLRIEGKLTLKIIADYWGSDHTSVRYSVQVIEDLFDERMRSIILNLINDYQLITDSKKPFIYQNAIFDLTDYEKDLTI